MATRYVNASTGNNGNTGTSSGAAWATLTYALSQISAGDTVKIAPGTYYEKLYITKANTTWEHDGTAGVVYIDGRYDPAEAFSGNINHILAPNDLPGNNWVLGSWGDVYTPLLEVRASGVTIDGKSKYGIVVRNVFGQAIKLKPGLSNITVKYVRTDFTYNAGWRIHSNSTLVEHCCCTRSGMTLYDPDRGDFLGEGVGPEAVPSAVLILDGDGCIMRDMLCHHSGGEGIVAGKRSTNVTIEDCESHNNHHINFYVNYSRHAIVRRNLAWSAVGEIESSDGFAFGDETGGDSAQYISQYGAQNAKFYNNIAYNCNRNFVLRGNQPTDPKGNYQTVVDGLYVGFNTFVANNPALVVKSNIHIGILHGPKRMLFENNIIETVAGSGVIPVAWQGVGSNSENVGVRNNIWRAQPIAAARGTNDIYGAPGIKSSTPTTPPLNYARDAVNFAPVSWRGAASFYELIGSSVAIDAASGVGAFKNNTPPDITTDFKNLSRTGGRDIGAYEFGGTVTEPGDELTGAFTQSSTGGDAPLSVTFTDTSISDGTVNYWRWDFGDGETGDEANPVHIYTAPGVYTPVLIVRDTNGLEDSFTGTVIAVTQPAPGGSGATAADIKRFTAPTSSGPGSVTFDNLDGAVPKAVIAMMVNATALETVTVGSMWVIGYAVGGGSNDQLCWSGVTSDGVDPTSTKSRLSSNPGAVLVEIDSNGDAGGALRVVSFSADTVNYDVAGAFATGYQCVFLALAGDGVSAETALETMLGGAGSSVSLGKAAASLAVLLDSFGARNQANDHVELSIGIANRDAQYAFNWFDKNGMADTTLQSWTGPEGFIGRARALGGARVKMVNLGTNPAYQVSVADANTPTSALLVRLPSSTRNTVEQQIAPSTGAGTVAYPLGYAPAVLILWGGLNPTADSVGWVNSSNSAFWMGFVTQDGSAFICVSSADAAGTSDTQVWTGATLEVYEGGNTKVIDAAVSLSETGYLIDWTDSQPMVFNAMAIEWIEAGTPDPVLGIDVSPTGGYAGLSLFTFTSTTNANGNTITGYAWDFGDGETGSGASAVHIYSDPGIYSVTLTVTLDTAEAFSLTVPNAVNVTPTVETTQIIQGPFLPNPLGVDWEDITPTFAGIYVDGLMPGIISHGLTAKEFRWGTDVENLTTPIPGRIRQIYDPAIEGWRFIRPDGATTTWEPVWTGGGGTGETPPDAPVLSAISNGDNDGDYTVSWSSVTGADSYTLQEKLGAGSWSTIYTGAGTSHNVTGNATGTWSYRVSATDGALTSGWSNTETATVASETTVTFYPTASSHDGWEGAGVTDIDDTNLPLTAATRWAAFWVDATAHVSGAKGNVTEAIFRYKATSTSNDDPHFDMYGDDVDTAAVIATSPGTNISGRTLTTAKATETATAIGTSLRSLDVTTVVQEITDRAGWTGPICLVADGLGSPVSNVRIYAYNNGSDYWELEITYSS